LNPSIGLKGYQGYHALEKNWLCFWVPFCVALVFTIPLLLAEDQRYRDEIAGFTELNTLLNVRDHLRIHLEELLWMCNNLVIDLPLDKVLRSQLFNEYEVWIHTNGIRNHQENGVGNQGAQAAQ